MKPSKRMLGDKAERQPNRLQQYSEVAAGASRTRSSAAIIPIVVVQFECHATSRTGQRAGIAELWPLRYLSAKHVELLAKD
jgi:hypothetical protein